MTYESGDSKDYLLKVGLLLTRIKYLLNKVRLSAGETCPIIY